MIQVIIIKEVTVVHNVLFNLFSISWILRKRWVLEGSTSNIPIKKVRVEIKFDMKNSNAKRNGAYNNNWEELRIFWHYWQQIKRQNDPNLGASFVESHFKAEDKRHNNRVGVDTNRYYEVWKACDEGRPVKRTALWGKIKYHFSKSWKSVDHIDDVHFDLTQEY